MEIQQAYEESLQREGYVRDPAQIEVIRRLSDLQQRLVSAADRKPGVLRRLFGKNTRELQKGLYIWGDVGRGKTFLMDLFFETLAIDDKRRVHFHRMMQEVHARLQQMRHVEDPLERVAADIARDTRVLCFDEFFVSDIGDAMILGRLLDGLFRRGVTLLTTSNIEPEGLYKDGLQRQQFLPAIELLLEHTTVINMDGETDYRLRLLQKAGTYFTPLGQPAEDQLDYYFAQTALSALTVGESININQRDIATRKTAKGIVWFEFAAVCDGPRSQADYIEIARWYQNVLISNIPTLGEMQENQTRRFIALVDEFYDRRVKLIVSAAAAPAGLYSGQRLRFEFDRTVSRLIEMQSARYLALPHLP